MCIHNGFSIGQVGVCTYDRQRGLLHGFLGYSCDYRYMNVCVYCINIRHASRVYIPEHVSFVNDVVNI